MEQTVLLRMTDITKTFPGVKALDHVSLEVKAGTVHALMGENGAGKSTLMKCLFGIYSKDSGHIYLEGREGQFHQLQGGAEQRCRHGSPGAESGAQADCHGQPVARALSQDRGLYCGRAQDASRYQSDFLKSSASTSTPPGHGHDAGFPASNGGDRKGRLLSLESHRI